MSVQHSPRPIALIGLSGAGKSAVAPLLAARVGGEPVDLDARVEARAGCSIAELFASRGENEFRRLEREELAGALSAGAGVIACGGGIVESSAARELLRQRCRCVWLEVAPGVAATRLGRTAAARPLLTSGLLTTRLDELLARRGAWYAEVATVRVGTDHLAAPEVAERVARALERETSAEGAA